MLIYLLLFSRNSASLLYKKDSGKTFLPTIKYDGLSLAPEDWLPMFGIDADVEFIRHETVTSRNDGVYTACVYAGFLKDGADIPKDYILQNVYPDITNIRDYMYICEASKCLNIKLGGFI